MSFNVLSAKQSVTEENQIFVRSTPNKPILAESAPTPLVERRKVTEPMVICSTRLHFICGRNYGFTNVFTRPPIFCALPQLQNWTHSTSIGVKTYVKQKLLMRFKNPFTKFYLGPQNNKSVCEFHHYNSQYSTLARRKKKEERRKKKEKRRRKKKESVESILTIKCKC